MSRYQLLVAHSYTEELEDEDSLELVEDDDELELDDLDENLVLLDDDCLVSYLDLYISTIVRGLQKDNCQSQKDSR